MINSLKIKNFTEFSEAKFEFSKGLNVVIGDNSTGKWHNHRRRRNLDRVINLDEELAMFDREQEVFYARQEGK